MGENVEFQFSRAISDSELFAFLSRRFRFERQGESDRYGHPDALYARLICLFAPDRFASRADAFPVMAQLLLEENYGNPRFNGLLIDMFFLFCEELGCDVALFIFEELVVEHVGQAFRVGDGMKFLVFDAASREHFDRRMAGAMRSRK